MYKARRTRTAWAAGFIRGCLVIMALIAGVFYFYGSTGRFGPSELKHLKDYKGPHNENRVDRSFRLITYNVGYFSGMTYRQPLKRARELFEMNLWQAAAALKKAAPDIVVLQEVDFRSSRTYDVNQMDGLAGALGFSSGAMAVGWDKQYVPFPFWPPGARVGRVLSGQAVLSRYPVDLHQRHVLPLSKDRPFYLTAFDPERIAQVVVLDLGRPLALINVHLEPGDRKVRMEQAHEVVRIVRALPADMPYIIAGDFNTVPVEARFKRGFSDEPETDYSGDETLGIIISGLDVKCAFSAEEYVFDEESTYTVPSDIPNRKLDHILYDPRQIVPVARDVLHEAGEASYHLPVVFEFRFIEAREGA